MSLLLILSGSSDAFAGAGLASGSGSAGGASVALAPEGALSAGSGASQDASASLAPTGEGAGGSGASGGPSSSVEVSADDGAGTGEAFDATVSTGTFVAADAELASGTGAAGDASASVGGSGGAAGGSGASGGPTSSVAPEAGHASGSGSAGDATVTVGENAEPEVASGSGAAALASASVGGSGGSASGSGASGGPSSTVKPVVGHASGTGYAPVASVFIQPSAHPEVAAGTGSAGQASVYKLLNPPLGSGSGGGAGGGGGGTGGGSGGGDSGGAGYLGRGKAIHVEPFHDFPSVYPSFPEHPGSFYPGQSLPIMPTDLSPRLNDSAVLPPLFQGPHYVGRSKAIHVFGDTPHVFDPTEIPACRCCAEECGCEDLEDPFDRIGSPGLGTGPLGPWVTPTISGGYPVDGVSAPFSTSGDLGVLSANYDAVDDYGSQVLVGSWDFPITLTARMTVTNAATPATTVVAFGFNFFSAKNLFSTDGAYLELYTNPDFGGTGSNHLGLQVNSRPLDTSGDFIDPGDVGSLLNFTGLPITVKWEITSDTISAKYWFDSDDEPEVWMVTNTGTTLTGPLQYLNWFYNGDESAVAKVELDSLTITTCDEDAVCGDCEDPESDPMVPLMITHDETDIERGWTNRTRVRYLNGAGPQLGNADRIIVDSENSLDTLLHGASYGAGNIDTGAFHDANHFESRFFAQHDAPLDATFGRLRFRAWARNADVDNPTQSAPWRLHLGSFEVDYPGGSDSTPRDAADPHDPHYDELGEILAQGTLLDMAGRLDTTMPPNSYEDVDVNVPVVDGKLRFVFRSPWERVDTYHDPPFGSPDHADQSTAEPVHPYDNTLQYVGSAAIWMYRNYTTHISDTPASYIVTETGYTIDWYGGATCGDSVEWNPDFVYDVQYELDFLDGPPTGTIVPDASVSSDLALWHGTIEAEEDDNFGRTTLRSRIATAGYGDLALTNGVVSLYYECTQDEDHVTALLTRPSDPDVNYDETRMWQFARCDMMFGVTRHISVWFEQGSLDTTWIAHVQSFSTLSASGSVPFTMPAAIEAGVKYSVRVAVDIGLPSDRVKVRVWRTDEEEPDDWTVEFSNSIVGVPNSALVELRWSLSQVTGSSFGFVYEGLTYSFFLDEHVVGQRRIESIVLNTVPLGSTLEECPEEEVCEDCLDGNDVPILPFTPGYLPIFRRQIGDPTTSLDSFICTLESGAMALDWHTRGAVQVWGGELIPWTGRSEASIHESGSNLGDVRQAWTHYGQHLDVRSGQTWSHLATALEEGRAVILQGDYDQFPASVKCQAGFEDNHAILLLPYISSDRILVADPLCGTFHGVPASVLQAYAEDLGAQVYGATSPQRILFAVTQGWAP